MQLTAVFRKVPTGYIGFIEELPGANAQAATLNEARSNLREAAQLVFEANRQLCRDALDSDVTSGGAEIIREVIELPPAA